MARRKQKPNKLLVFIVVGLAIITLIASALFASGNSSLRLPWAWECSKYNFTVKQNGEVWVENASANAEGATQVEVYINAIKINPNLEAPPLQPNSAAVKIGTVAVPSGAFTWRAIAVADRRCDDSGSYSQPVNCNYVDIKVTQ